MDSNGSSRPKTPDLGVRELYVPPFPSDLGFGGIVTPLHRTLAVKALLMLLGWHTIVVVYVPPLEVLSVGSVICVATLFVARHPWKCCVPVEVGFEVFVAAEFARIA